MSQRVRFEVDGMLVEACTHARVQDPRRDREILCRLTVGTIRNYDIL